MSKGGIVKGTFEPDVYYEYSGQELFWCLTFSTGLLAFSADIGIDLMALRLLVLEIFCVVGLQSAINRPIWSLPLRLYVVYLIWIVIGCFYSPSIGYAIRVVLKYCYPLLICLFASKVVRDQETFLKASTLARTVALVSLIFSFVPFFISLVPGVFWYGTARAINFISIMTLSLGMYFFTNEKRKNLIYVLLFMFPCFLWVLRTSIMGSLVAIMAFSFIRYRLKSLPIIMGILMAGVIAVFTIPSLRQKMFHGENVTVKQFESGKVGKEKVNTNAREYMWTELMARFYNNHELSGSGTGTVQNYMYNHPMCGGLKVPHSDFVQMMCDNGLIGLVLYIMISLFIFFHAFIVYWSTNEPILRLSAIVAGASMAGVFVTLYSDNVVNYSMATLSMPYGFYGMMLGLHKTYSE
jgi:O-antigen ligase